ncbi:MAG: Uma2 family endonuclease [Arcicella sp.]|jgi:Uma2 family endonuclease|nr:Uma2 family endonuclease [Arcicella sp.]
MNSNKIIYMGIDAPRIHQEIITKLVYGVTSFYKNGETMLFPYPETMIDESETSPVPDVMLVNRENDLAEVIIEITHTQGFKKDIQKIRELMEEYNVPEGFVYDYKLKIWQSIASTPKNAPQSFCEALQYDLNNFLID